MSGPMDEPRIEPTGHYRAPSQYERCRRPRCHQPPVADMARTRYERSGKALSWYAYCADHLREYNREVRDGRVWWLGRGDQAAEGF